MLLEPVVKVEPALLPTAVLLLPVVTPDKEALPNAWFSEPSVSVFNALSPTPVLTLPIVTFVKAFQPIAVFSLAVFETNVDLPTAVFLIPDTFSLPEFCPT